MRGEGIYLKRGMMWLTSEALSQNIGVRDLICEAEKAGVCRNGMNTLQQE